MGDKKSAAPSAASASPASSAPPSAAPSSQPFKDAGATTLPNKPTEPAFKMALNLTQIEFKCTDDRKPVSVLLKFQNPSQESVTYKVRCTSADIFRVQPPLGIVKPQEIVSITIWYQNQDKKEALSKSHYFAFYHAKTDGRTARELWANAKPDGVRRVPAVFHNLK